MTVHQSLLAGPDADELDRRFGRTGRESPPDARDRTLVGEIAPVAPAQQNRHSERVPEVVSTGSERARFGSQRLGAVGSPVQSTGEALGTRRPEASHR